MNNEYNRLSARLEKEMTADAIAERITRRLTALLALLVLPVFLLFLATAGTGLVWALLWFIEHL